MAWESEYVNYGVVKIEGDKVIVYRDQWNSITLSTGMHVVNASWAGGELNVYLDNGQVKRYSDQWNSITI